MCTFLRTRARNTWKESVKEGKEWICGHGWVVLVGTRRAWTCSPRYWIPSVMLPEGFRQKVRDQEWIQSEFFALPFVHLPCEIRVFLVHGPPVICFFLVFSGLQVTNRSPRQPVPPLKTPRSSWDTQTSDTRMCKVVHYRCTLGKSFVKPQNHQKWRDHYDRCQSNFLSPGMTRIIHETRVIREYGTRTSVLLCRINSAWESGVVRPKWTENSTVTWPSDRWVHLGWNSSWPQAPLK